MSFSRKEIDELKPVIERTVLKMLGFNEPTLVTAAINCLDKGYDKKKTVDKLSGILDNSQASKFAEKLFGVYGDYQTMSAHRDKAKKRKQSDDKNYDENKKAKKSTIPSDQEDVKVFIPEPGNPSPGQLTADKIKEMMANAQKMIQERKVQLSMTMPTTVGSGSNQEMLMADAMEKVKKANELQARIQAKLANVGLPPVTMPLTMTGPTPVILDEEGRTIDVKTGQAIQLQHHMPTLKANIRAKKREQFKAVHERPPEEISESKFFDFRLGLKGAQRSRRAFKFFEKGRFERLAQRMRTKAQLEKLQSEIALAAKKTGIASAAKLATIQPKKDIAEDDVPDVEWWDAVILRNETYSSLDNFEGKDKFEGITHLCEHPIQMKPPAEPTKSVEIPVMLTKKERKKLRRQNRTEGQKELQEKIRLGLIPPPEPKVRMANLMRVLGTEAVQDPTKVEAHVRAQMAKRQRAHEEANAARKLTKVQKREKKIKKIKEDTSLGISVSVYRVRDLTNQSKKFKVETNADQLFMTGLVVLHKDCNVIVVEGGPRQQKKFRKLVMHRIKWSEDQHQQVKDDDDDDDDEVEEKKVNSCNLVWEGTVKNRAFGEVKFKMCPTESFAREQFKKHNVEHYWDLAYSGSILETTTEDS